MHTHRGRDPSGCDVRWHVPNRLGHCAAIEGFIVDRRAFDGGPFDSRHILWLLQKAPMTRGGNVTCDISESTTNICTELWSTNVIRD
jgi:hypothetical protein